MAIASLHGMVGRSRGVCVAFLLHFEAISILVISNKVDCGNKGQNIEQSKIFCNTSQPNKDYHVYCYNQYMTEQQTDYEWTTISL